MDEPQPLKKQTWGPSVPHYFMCPALESSFNKCACPKRFYCGRCDEQHQIKDRCPRSVLDALRDALYYKDEFNLKKIVIEILDSAKARVECPQSTSHGLRLETHVESRINELVERHGNLSITRKRLRNLVLKEEKRQRRRASRVARAEESRIFRCWP